jgi:hypothetical protein
MVAALSTASPVAGMRHCVMCGKLRPLKAGNGGGGNNNNNNNNNNTKGNNTASGEPYSSTRAKVYMEPSTVMETEYADDNNGTTTNTNTTTTNESHIIPTQNKGVCTACDVTVWVFVQGRVEIKWCKGCKNFKPWIAFGEKLFGTKCLQCRDRQRGKYAEQKVVKDRIRWGIGGGGVSSKSSLSSSSSSPPLATTTSK